MEPQKDINGVESDMKPNRVMFVAKLNPSPERLHLLQQDIGDHFSKFGTVQRILLSGRNCKKNDSASAAEKRNQDDQDFGVEIVDGPNRTNRPSLVPPFAFVEMETTPQAQRAIEDFERRNEQRDSSRLFGYLAYATGKIEYMDHFLKQQQGRKQTAKAIRQERRAILKQWTGAVSNCGTGILLETHKSHEERLKGWLKTLRSKNGINLCTVAEDSLQLFKSASLLFLNSTTMDPHFLLEKIQTTWYVSTNIHRITVMNKVVDSSFEGRLRDDIVPAIIDKVRNEAARMTQEPAVRAEEQDGLSDSQSATVVRVFVSPSKLQKPLLKLLWQHLDNQSEQAIEFSHKNATHTMSVIQAHSEEDSENDGIFLVGRLESIKPAQKHNPRKSKNALELDDFYSVKADAAIEAAMDHENWKIALYYVYVDQTPSQLQEHIDFQRKLCERLQLNGRVRVSREGVNGVLSGRLNHLRKYEAEFSEALCDLQSTDDVNHDPDWASDDRYPNRLDMKYCHLRKDLPVQSQLFDRLVVKETKTVINLFDGIGNFSEPKTSKKQSGRYRRRRERKAMQNDPRNAEKDTLLDLPSLYHAVMEEPVRPSKHLSAAEWNRKLDDVESSDNALLVDVRNVYESKVGHFAHPTTPTLLTNTRKYSDLVSLLASNPQLKDTKRKQVFMYCTGGVRCERVSMLVNQLYPEKEIYQLKGGIQNYLRDCHEQQATGATREQQQYFVGKNFVFDPRRTDPVHFGEVVGKCLVCGSQHDDYDNGHSPNDNCEARCNKCRMLVLICNECRPNWRCHGEKADGGDEGDAQPLLYCNIHYCIHEGAAPEPTLVFGKGNKEPSNHFETFDNDHVCRAYQKLKEAWERYKFDPPSYQDCASSCLVAIDCGAAPGGWSEFLLQKIRCSRVFAVDPAQLSENLSQDERLRYISMKIQDALPLIRQELLGSRSPVSIWVCDMNCRELSFPIDCLLEARRLGLVGAGTFFVLTLKLVKGHTVTTFEMLVQKQIQRLLNGLEDCRFEKVQVLHLFSNRIRERTVMGYCA